MLSVVTYLADLMLKLVQPQNNTIDCGVGLYVMSP
jgi:hypothetical protein